MAIARGAGTEIIRSHHIEAIDSADRTLIFGVQHHIYTVLSIIVHAAVINASGDWIEVLILGYDAGPGGTTAQEIPIFRQDMNLNETFVWNDKFSFNGHEPVDFTGNLDSIAKQDAIADQGSAVPQKLMAQTEHGSDGFDATVTFIDQNNS
jgi:hypothetical protein